MDYENNWNSGRVITDAGMLISYPRMNVDDFKKLPICEESNIDTADGGIRYIFTLRNISLSGDYWRVSGNFYHNEIVRIVLHLESEVAKPSIERIRSEALILYEQFVSKFTSQKTPVLFDWGFILACPYYYDDVPEISIGYDHGEMLSKKNTKWSMKSIFGR